MMKKILGIIGIILGIILILCPLAGFLVEAMVAGISLIFLGIFIIGAGLIGQSKIVNIILGLIMLILGVLVIFYPPIASLLVAYISYIIGLLIIIVSIVNLFTAEGAAKFVSVVGIIFGILYLLIGFIFTTVAGPIILGILVGLGLIVAGAKCLVDPA